MASPSPDDKAFISGSEDISLLRILRRTSALLAPLLAFTMPCYAAALPDALLGRWQVAEVHTNTNATFKTNYVWNDARLRWRIFNFSSSQVRDDTSDSTTCETPQATTMHVALVKLMDGSLGHTGDDSDPDSMPNPEAYQLKATPNEQVDAISITCKGGLWQSDLGTGQGMMGSWMYVTPAGQLVIRWRDETLLVLNRLPQDAKPQASFDCSKAASPVEKTICGSIQLASFDRSVAWSYKVARDDAKSAGNSMTPLTTSQRAWLSKRDACGTDSACLLSAMKQRLDALANDAQ